MDVFIVGWWLVTSSSFSPTFAQVPGSGSAGGRSAGGMDVRDQIEGHAGWPGGDATRHLRAAAYLDRDFRIGVIEELVEHQYRVPAPALGVDNALVLDECLRARRAASVASGAVIGVGLIGLLIAPDAVGAALAVLIGFLLLGVIVRSIGSRLKLSPDSVVTGRRRSATGLIIGVIVLFALSFLVSVVLLVFAAFSNSGSLFSGSTASSGFDQFGQAQTQSSGPSPVGVIVVLLLWVAVGAVYRYQRHARIASLLRPVDHSVVPGLSFPALKAVFKRLHERSAEAETVYSGFNAFVGSGIEAREEGWTFAVELRPNEQRRTNGIGPDPLETPDLHEQIAAGVAALGGGSLYPGDLLRRISVRDRVFRSGMHSTPPDAWYGQLSVFNQQTGRRELARDWADLLDLGAHERLRHYLEARVELWESQVVASVFLRIHVQGGLLQMEGMPFVLPPVKEQYRIVDQIASADTFSNVLSALWKAIIALPRDVLGSPIEPVAWVRSAFRTGYLRQWYERMLHDHRAVDHGPRFSLRELGAEPYYQQRFQEVDVDRFFSSVRKRVATVILDVLKRGGYDVSEFEQFVQSINVNSGIQNFNSNVSGPQAAGQGARVHTRTGGQGTSR